MYPIAARTMPTRRYRFRGFAFEVLFFDVFLVGFFRFWAVPFAFGRA